MNKSSRYTCLPVSPAVVVLTDIKLLGHIVYPTIDRVRVHCDRNDAPGSIYKQHWDYNVI